MKRPVIVGIDVGVTVGIAIMDTKGKLISLESKREAKLSEIIEHIWKFGKPIIIASDVNPAPKKVERLARSLGSKLFYPEVSLSNLEKMKIVKKYLKKINCRNSRKN